MLGNAIRLAALLCVGLALDVGAQVTNSVWNGVCRTCHGPFPNGARANASGAPALLNAITPRMFGRTLTPAELTSVTHFLEQSFQTSVIRASTTFPGAVAIDVSGDVVLGARWAELTELVTVTPPASGSVSYSGTTINFTPAATGTYSFTYRARNAGDSISTSTRTVIVDVLPLSAAPGNYQGLWWGAPAGSESGWGLNVTHQGDILFATWFTYDTDGSGLWMVMSSGAKTGNATYSGTLYRTRGPAFDAAQWNSTSVVATDVGFATLTFHDAGNGTFATTVNGLTQSKPITRQLFASTVPTCTAGGTPAVPANYQDLWWASPAGSESGWGVNLTHQGDILFATWFTYDATGKGQWFVAPDARSTGPGTFSGTLYRTTGPAYSSASWNPSAIGLTAVGTAGFSFSDANTGVFSYTVGAVSASKPITRQVYSTPQTVCR